MVDIMVVMIATCVDPIQTAHVLKEQWDLGVHIISRSNCMITT